MFVTASMLEGVVIHMQTVNGLGMIKVSAGVQTKFDSVNQSCLIIC